MRPSESQTPFWIGFHDGSFDSYNGNTPASSRPRAGSVALEPLQNTAFSGQATPNAGVDENANIGDAGDLTGFAGFMALIAQIQAGNVHVNIHTEREPSGEIRGQLELY